MAAFPLHSPLAMSGRKERIKSFRLKPGDFLTKKYRVVEQLGGGWEGEVYHVRETNTDIDRAAKLFFPYRNKNNDALKTYAKRLEKLKDCPTVLRYHTQESFEHRGEEVYFMVSEYVKGRPLSQFTKRQRGRRVEPFRAVHILHALCTGVQEIHSHREYHGDLHADNVLILQIGLGFRIKFFDFYYYGPRRREHIQSDIVDLVNLFYNLLGGKNAYAKQPPEMKYICCGLKRSLIIKKFPTVARLRRHLETLPWEKG